MRRGITNPGTTGRIRFTSQSSRERRLQNIRVVAIQPSTVSREAKFCFVAPCVLSSYHQHSFGPQISLFRTTAIQMNHDNLVWKNISIEYL